MPPAIAPGPQMGRPAPAVLVQRYRHLADLHAGQRSLDHNLAGEFHAGRIEAHPSERIDTEAAQTAVEVAYLGCEEDSSRQRQHGVADPAMRPRHRTLVDPTRKAVAHDEVITYSQPLENGWDLCEVIALVGVTHDDVST